MAPWMVIVGLIVIGFVVLLVAPTVHRRINANSRAIAETGRIERAKALRDSPNGASRTFDTARQAVRVRDRLLLRGVRSELLSEDGDAALIFNSADATVVDSVLDELGIET